LSQILDKLVYCNDFGSLFVCKRWNNMIKRNADFCDKKLFVIFVRAFIMIPSGSGDGDTLLCITEVEDYNLRREELKTIRIYMQQSMFNNHRWLQGIEARFFKNTDIEVYIELLRFIHGHEREYGFGISHAVHSKISWPKIAKRAEFKYKNFNGDTGERESVCFTYADLVNTLRENDELVDELNKYTTKMESISNTGMHWAMNSISSIIRATFPRCLPFAHERDSL
jgi:hypothetical protein